MKSITISVGKLNACGKLNKKTIRHTEKTSRAVGATKNGIFGGGMKSNSTTTSTIILTLSLLKVGNDVYSQFEVPLEAMYEILYLDDDISVIVSSKNVLLAVKNHTKDIQISIPYYELSSRSFIPNCYLYGGMIVAVLGVIWFFGGHPIIAIPIVIVGIWAIIKGNRIDHIELDRLQNEWDEMRNYY